MLGIFEDQWRKINYHEMERSEYYDIDDSPLEILKKCMIDDCLMTYPPPELLIFIGKQFEYYLDNEGDVSLEEAFFGKPVKGKGVYAKRQADENNSLYKSFHFSYNRKQNKLSQEKLIDELCKNEPLQEDSHFQMMDY